MWPWGHLALGYLCYAGYLGIWKRESPRGWPVILLAIGTQFPDAVDKPLAYWFGVIPEGRALTHSLVVFVPLAVLLVLIGWNYGRTEHATAFSIGWGSHLIGDAIHPIVEGAYWELTFLVWPILPAPNYEAADFYFHLQKLLLSLRNLNLEVLMRPGEDMFILELWLAIGVILLWVVQGMPPLGSIWRWIAASVDGRRASRQG